MSSITPAGSVASQPPIAPVQPVRTSQDQEQAVERNAERASELAATAVAAQSSKDARKGVVFDIKV